MTDKKTVIGVIGAGPEHGKLLAKIAEMGLTEKIEVVQINENTTESEGLKMMEMIAEEAKNIASLTGVPPKYFGKQEPVNHKRKPSRYKKR